VRFCLWSDIGFRNLLLVFAVKVMVLLVNRHPGSEAHEQVLEVSPRRGAHRLLLGAGKLRQAVHEGPVTLAQLMRAQAALALSGANAIRRSSVTFPLVGDKVGQVVL